MGCSYNWIYWLCACLCCSWPTGLKAHHGQMFGGLGAKSFTELHSETKRGISTLSFAYEIFKRANFVPVVSSRCTCRRQSPWYISTSPASPYARVLYEIRYECCKESAAVENADHAHRVGNPGALEDQDQGRGRVIASPLCQVRNRAANSS